MFEDNCLHFSEMPVRILISQKRTALVLAVGFLVLLISGLASKIQPLTSEFLFTISLTGAAIITIGFQYISSTTKDGWWIKIWPSSIEFKGQDGYYKLPLSSVKQISDGIRVGTFAYLHDGSKVRMPPNDKYFSKAYLFLYAFDKQLFESRPMEY